MSALCLASLSIAAEEDEKGDEGEESESSWMTSLRAGLESRLGVPEAGCRKLGTKGEDMEARRLGFRAGISEGEDDEVMDLSWWLRPRRRLLLGARGSSRRCEELREEKNKGEMMVLLARLRIKDWRFSARGLSSVMLVLRLTRRMLRYLSMARSEGAGTEWRWAILGGSGKSEARVERRLVPWVLKEPPLLRRLSDSPLLILECLREGRMILPCMLFRKLWPW